MRLLDFMHEGEAAPWFEPDAVLVGSVPVTCADGTNGDRVLVRLLVDGEIGAMDVILSKRVAAKFHAAIGELIA